MKSLKFAIILIVLLITTNCVQAQKETGADKIYGDWTGESICANKEKFPACKDEKVVYHFSKSTIEAKPIHLAADKIVNGENEPMGEFDLTYDAENKTLFDEFITNQNRLIWEFKINGDQIVGTLKTLPEKILVRNVSVTKQKDK